MHFIARSIREENNFYFYYFILILKAIFQIHLNKLLMHVENKLIIYFYDYHSHFQIIRFI